MTTPVVQSAATVKTVAGNHPLARLLRRPGGLLGTAWLVLVIGASLTAPLWLPYSTEHQDFTAVLATPSAAHWLGTDELGRDLLSRIFAAGGGTLGASALAAVVAMVVAIPLALWAASRGARVENIINRVTEIAMALPAIVIMLAVIGVVGTNIQLIMVILGLLISAGIYRVFVGQAKAVQAQLYVDAASVDGVRPVGISLRHVLPGILNTVMVQFALVFAIAIMIQAGLAFIGFGPPIPQPSWGGMIQSASQHVYDAPWLMVPTGVVLALTVLSANAIGDALSGAADAPQLQIALGRAARRASRAPAVAPTAAASTTTGTASAGTDATGTDATGTDAAGADGLAVSNLSIGITGGTTLVSNVSLTVRAGAVLGLVGESGCGKTLTALSLIGLLPPGLAPLGGTIMWNGRDLARLSERELMRVRGSQIALISQEPMRALDPMFTVGYQLQAAIRRLQHVGRAAAHTEARSLLEKVGIVDAPRVLASYPHQISGGMAQRVAIALALSGKPRLLVADEPTTALDVTVQAEILGLLRELIADTGMSLVLVTHDLGVVADICDDVAVMYAGEVVESGTVTSVLERPQHPYAMALLAADPHAGTGAGGAERLASIPGQVPPPDRWPSGCRFAARCQFATDACSRPIRLAPRREAQGEVRCIRSDELLATGQRWHSGEPPADVLDELGSEPAIEPEEARR